MNTVFPEDNKTTAVDYKNCKSACDKRSTGRGGGAEVMAALLLYCLTLEKTNVFD